MEPTMKLTYFDLSGLAEPVRMALAMSGKPWTDNRISAEQFSKLKPCLPYGQVPVLEVDGKVLAQSLALLRYAGKLAGIYPTDDIEAAYADAAADSTGDIHPKLVATFFEKDNSKKMEMRKQLAEVHLPKWLDNLEKNLGEAGGKHFAGNKISTGDLAVVARLRWFTDGSLDGIPTTILEKYPMLSALVTCVSTEPKIAAYLESTAK